MEYTTVEHLKNFLGIAADDETKDDDLQALITQATALVDVELGDNLEEVTNTRRIDGNGVDRIIMENVVTAVASVNVLPESYEIPVDFIESSVIYLTENTPRGRRNIEITYTKGYTEVPDDMERFFLQYCRELYNMQSSADTEVVKSQSLGGGLSLSYFSPSELQERMVQLDSVIQKYKNFNI